MTDDKELLGDSMDMFAHGNSDLPTTAETPEPTRTDTAPADRTRDDQGRFAPKEVAATPTPAPAAPTPPITPEVDPEKQPITKAEFKGMLEEREKRQKAEARALAAEAELQRARQSQPPSDLDPELAQRIQGARTDAIFTTSERWAKKEHGEDTVNSAMEWALQRAQQNPAFASEYLKQDHPIDWAVKQQKRDRILSEIGDDPDAFIEARIAARLSKGDAPPAAAAQPSPAASPQPASLPTPQVPAPTRSIANATSAGGLQVAPQGEFAAIDGMFNR